MMIRATQENELGELYLSNVDFLKNGVPASIVATVVRVIYCVWIIYRLLTNPATGCLDRRILTDEAHWVSRSTEASSVR